ncbi:hypothetical protein RJ55_05343 [Drechmeria coniospora]|nr:hypothetical protein RJ55_05343 [Drechmeria coniospora]
MASTAVVPWPYVFFFKYLDPLTALYGAYLNFADPTAAVQALAPSSVYDPDQVFLFHQAGGLAIAIAVLTALVPRLSSDLVVWRILQGALLLSDFAGLSGIYFALARQDRLAPARWTADDFGCGSTYLVLTVIRLLFVLGVGFAATVAPARGSPGRKNV